MKLRMEAACRRTAATVALALSFYGCKDDSHHDENPLPPANLAGTAIVDLKLLAAPIQIGHSLTPPLDAYPGYTPMSVDLNDTTGGDYVWLYYKTGPADGSEGEPLGEIYIVDETAGEKLESESDKKLPTNLTSGCPTVGSHKLYLAFKNSDWPVVRGIAVANVNTDYDTVEYEYAPPGVEKKYPIVWLKERKDDGSYPAVPGPWEPKPADLNEGTSSLFDVTNYIFMGYFVDQEVHDWLEKK